MGYFSDLIDSGLITRALTVRGKTKDTYWRPLTAGQRVELLRGQVIKSDGTESRVMEIVLADSAERQQKLVQMTLCTEDGTPVYKSLKELQAEPAWLADALGRLAQQVHEGDEGNG